MENPKSRPAAAKLIDGVIKAHYENRVTIGWSLAMKIYDALVREGYLVEGFRDEIRDS